MKLPTDPPTQKTVVVHHPNEATNQNQVQDPNQPGCSLTNQNSEPVANQKQPEIQSTNQNPDTSPPTNQIPDTPVTNQKQAEDQLANQNLDPPPSTNQNTDITPLPVSNGKSDPVIQMQPFIAVNPLASNAAPIETGTAAGEDYIDVSPPPVTQSNMGQTPVISADDINDLAQCNQFNSTPHCSQEKNTSPLLSPIQVRVYLLNSILPVVLPVVLSIVLPIVLPVILPVVLPL